MGVSNIVTGNKLSHHTYIMTNRCSHLGILTKEGLIRIKCFQCGFTQCIGCPIDPYRICNVCYQEDRIFKCHSCCEKDKWEGLVSCHNCTYPVCSKHSQLVPDFQKNFCSGGYCVVMYINQEISRLNILKKYYEKKK